ncbi:MAG: lysophospholipid acyltransferase family protein [Clostridium sp.]|nr:lysophospholipid acyltransferase family protein [Clostridium sp.]
MKILHAILYALLKFAARMPFWALYALSDVMFALAYYLVRYRRKVVNKNLRESFPEKSEKELRTIAHKFYRNFTDYLVETIKLLHISDEEMMRRMQFEGMETVDRLLGEGRSIAAYFSHCFNWEWAPSITLWSALPNYALTGEGTAFCQVYRPLRDEWFDALMLRVRGRFNPISLPKQRTLRELLTLRRDGIPSITGFMSDQKPSHGDPTYVTTFLHHPTAMITGTETVARRLGMAAVYWDMHKVSRGHYKITIRLIAENVADTEPMAVTDEYTRLLQANIEREPALWLWSHKRWKIPVEIKSEG